MLFHVSTRWFLWFVRYVAGSVGYPSLRVLSPINNHCWFGPCIYFFNLCFILKVILLLKFNSLPHHVLQNFIIFFFFIILLSWVAQNPTLHFLVFDVLLMISQLEPLLFWIVLKFHLIYVFKSNYNWIIISLIEKIIF